MEKTLVFAHSLDMALRLVDTTTGRNVSGRGMAARAGGSPVRFSEKEGGILIFQNLKRRKFRLELLSPAYEPVELEVDLDALEKLMPLIEVHLIPGENYPGGAEFLTVEGRLPGIGELAAVRVGESSCLIREFEPRKRLVKLFNPHHLAMDRVFYALVNPDQNQCEPFRIVRQIDDQTVKVDRALETPFKNYFPISPLVLGSCRPDGAYRLRVRDDAGAAKWLLRWTVDGEARFRAVDFRETPRPRLEDGGG